MLEVFENRHVIEMARGPAFFPDSYRVHHERVPTDLIAAAYSVTYGIAGEELIERLWGASRALEVTTESFLIAAGVVSPPPDVDPRRQAIVASTCSLRRQRGHARGRESLAHRAAEPAVVRRRR